MFYGLLVVNGFISSDYRSSYNVRFHLKHRSTYKHTHLIPGKCSEWMCLCVCIITHACACLCIWFSTKLAISTPLSYFHVLKTCISVSVQLQSAHHIWPSFSVRGGTVTETGSSRFLYSCSEAIQLSTTVCNCVEYCTVCLLLIHWLLA